MELLRTPDDRFSELPEYPFTPHYAEIPLGIPLGIAAGDDGTASLRVHYVDEGPTDGAPVLLLHGEPTWSFLYRRMIPPLVSAGHRVIVPDLVGFGRSDKPTRQSDHTYARHVAWMSSLVFDVLDLQEITFFGQDWGGLIGLRLVAAQPDRYARVVIGNTGLPTGHGPASDAFLAWQKYSQEAPTLDIGSLIAGGCTTDPAPEVIAAYDAPFPDDSYKAGARILPALVPTSPDDPATADNENAWKVLSTFDKPFLLAFSDKDPITRGGDAPFRAKVPGAQGQTHPTIEGGGHFLQEDRGPQLAQVIADFVATT